MTFHPDDLPDLTGKVYIVTGGNTGIGYHTVSHLAQHGAHVYMCSRNPSKGTAAISALKTAHPTSKISLLILDHEDLSTILPAVQKFLSLETKLHGLINNAGIMATPFLITKDGYESQFQTNYIAHWLLTSYLLPVLLKTSLNLPSGSVRIVNVSSGGHALAPKVGINFADTSLPNSSGMTRYGQSKLANVLHTKVLNKVYGPDSKGKREGKGEIWCSTVHPGMVDTQLGDKAVLPWVLRKVFEVAGALGGSVNADTGSWTSLFCVAGDMGNEGCGGYFQRIAKPGWVSSSGRDEALAERLEVWTRGEMVKGGWWFEGKV